MARLAIPDFQLANLLYRGSSVSFYTVDPVTRLATTTLATLYDDMTGTGVLTNPQVLDADGKFARPVYVEDPVIGSVDGLHVSDHDTAIIGELLLIEQMQFTAMNAEAAVASHAREAKRNAALSAADVVLALAAQTAAELAEAHAETAEANAETAQGLSEAAQAAAVAAQGLAETAQAAAELAETHAETAETNAETAEANAEAAQAAAEAARDSLALKWLFDTSTSMADPGTGDLRLNHATVASATAIAFSSLLATTGNPDASAFIATWDDSTNTTIKGHVIIRKSGTPGTFAVFSVSAVTDNGTWLQATAAYVDGAGTLSSADALYVTFTRAGDKGADGAGSGDMMADGTVAMTGSLRLGATLGVVFEGTTADDFETTLTGGEPTADRAITLPNASGELMLSGPTLVSLEGLTLAAGDILYATAADTLTNLAKGTTLQQLRMNAGATAPEWAAASNTQIRQIHTSDTAIAACSAGGTQIGGSFSATIPAKGRIDIVISQARFDFTLVANASVGIGINIGGTAYFVQTSGGATTYAPCFIPSASGEVYRGGLLVNTGANYAVRLMRVSLDIEDIACATGAQTCYMILGHTAATGVTDVPTVKGATTALTAHIDFLTETTP